MEASSYVHCKPRAYMLSRRGVSARQPNLSAWLRSCPECLFCGRVSPPVHALAVLPVARGKKRGYNSHYILKVETTPRVIVSLRCRFPIDLFGFDSSMTHECLVVLRK